MFLSAPISSHKGPTSKIVSAANCPESFGQNPCKWAFKKTEWAYKALAALWAVFSRAAESSAPANRGFPT